MRRLVTGNMMMLGVRGREYKEEEGGGDGDKYGANFTLTLTCAIFGAEN